MKNLSIKTKLLLIVIVTILLVATMIALKSIYEINNLTQQNIEEYKQNAYSTANEELKSFTNFAKNIVVHLYNQSLPENVKENARTSKPRIILSSALTVLFSFFPLYAQHLLSKKLIGIPIHIFRIGARNLGTPSKSIQSINSMEFKNIPVIL